jgi:glycosyltransferase involved in cell wall biosynthesis
MNKYSKITVCVPTYNRYKDLENLIISFLKQNYQNSELLILDDLGSGRIGEVARKWMKKSKKIVYHKNSKNLGFSNNMRQGFEVASGDIIVFMGDDDIFIDEDALKLFNDAFEDKNVAVVKASQILFKNGQVNQAFPLKVGRENMVYYEKGIPTFENIWFESISISGLAFRKTKQIANLITKSKTLYPQVELMGRVCLKYNSAEINKHIIGVQSHSGQLNCIYYDIDGVRINILDDWIGIYDRIEKFSFFNKLKFYNRKRFMEKFTKFCLYFLPYNTITNGRSETLMFISKIFKYNKLIILVPFFWISSFISLVLPKNFIVFFTEALKRIRIKNQLSYLETTRLNKILKKYYV